MGLNELKTLGNFMAFKMIDGKVFSPIIDNDKLMMNMLFSKGKLPHNFLEKIS